MDALALALDDQAAFARLAAGESLGKLVVEVSAG